MTGVALAHRILGTFLGVVCHCFPPPLDVPTFVARCLYVRNDATDPSSERWNCGRERCQVILPKFRFPRKFRDLLHAVNLRRDRRLYFPSEGRRAEDFFALKIRTASAGFEPANLGTKGQHATPRPPKPLIYQCMNLKVKVLKCCADIFFSFLLFVSTEHRDFYRTEFVFGTFIKIWRYISVFVTISRKKSNRRFT